jgi:chromate transporter
MTSTPTHAGTVGEVARIFLRLGATAFGGPAAHIGLFRQELVHQRAWVTDEQFIDLLGVTNLIPGPNSTEMAIHLGHVRAGWRGAIAAGVCFILPAAILVLLLAILYLQIGSTPTAAGLLYGVKPVIIAIVAHALYGLLGKALKNRTLLVLAAGALAVYLLGADEIAVLFGFAFAYLLIRRGLNGQNGILVGLPAALQIGLSAMPVSLPLLFFNFLKIGTVLYGSGYVLLAFIRTDFVEGLGWLTNQQLLDAVAVGQFTPGPLFTTATFVGYLVGEQIGVGLLGALLATVGIFLPSFIFVLLTNPLIPRLRQNAALSTLLDGVNAAALALMAGVTFQLGISALVDILTLVLAAVSLLVLIRTRINATWLIIAGALIGLLIRGLA